MKIVAIIQARVGSTRLPRKVLLDLAGKTVLERVLERVSASRHVNEIVVATTIKKEDLEIVQLCSSIGVSVYCGSENDVLDRYYQAAKLYNADNIVRITADCPLLDPTVLDEVIALHLKKKADYTSNNIKETYPVGLDVEVFTFATLKHAWREANLMSEREHVTPYIKKNSGLFNIAHLDCEENLTQKRWVLDRPEDYEFIKIVYESLSKQDPLFGMQKILAFLDENSELEKLNKHIVRNEYYYKSLENDKVVNIDGVS